MRLTCCTNFLYYTAASILATGEDLSFVSYHAGSSCTGKPVQSVPVPDMCFVGGDDDDNDDIVGGGDDNSVVDDNAVVEGDDNLVGDGDDLPNGKHGQHISDRAGEAVLQQARDWLHDRAVASEGILSSKHHAPASVQKDPKRRAQLAQKAKAAQPAAVNAVPLAAVPTRSPTVAPVTDDVNYSDQDDVDDENFEYDDYVYVYDHDEYDFGDQLGDDDTGYLNPPPSVSTTAFPTSTAEAKPPHSMRMMCQAAPQKKDVSFTAEQVRASSVRIDYCARRVSRALPHRPSAASLWPSSTAIRPPTRRP
jgi:hypothetical protein